MTVVPAVERERVLCPGCGLKVNVRHDNTIAEHLCGHKPARARCLASGTEYDRHVATIARAGAVWVVYCRCGEAWAGPGASAVECRWREHCEQNTATQATAEHGTTDSQRRPGRRQEVAV